MRRIVFMNEIRTHITIRDDMAKIAKAVWVKLKASVRTSLDLPT